MNPVSRQYYDWPETLTFACDDVVSLEHRARLVARELHGHALWHAGPHEGPRHLAGGTYSASSSDNHKVTEVDIDGATSLLRAKREALLDQLAAVDRALAALTAAGIIVANAQDLHTAEPAEEPTTRVVPTRVKPRRVLSDEHRHALTEGRRKARHSKDAAAGRARETLDLSPGLAPAPTATDLPRLVKRHAPGSRR